MQPNQLVRLILGKEKSLRYSCGRVLSLSRGHPSQSADKNRRSRDELSTRLHEYRILGAVTGANTVTEWPRRPSSQLEEIRQLPFIPGNRVQYWYQDIHSSIVQPNRFDKLVATP